MRMKIFIAKVMHDRGMMTLKVTALTKKGAINQIMQAEKCPRRAIVDIWAQSVLLGRSMEFRGHKDVLR